MTSKAHGLVVFLCAAVIVAALSACSGTRLLYSKAESPPQYAKAVLMHHNAIGEQVADLRDDPTVSERTKARLLEGYRLTVCSSSEIASKASTATCAAGPAQRLETAAKAYAGLSSASTEAELQAAVDALVAELVKLITLVNEAK